MEQAGRCACSPHPIHRNPYCLQTTAGRVMRGKREKKNTVLLDVAHSSSYNDGLQHTILRATSSRTLKIAKAPSFGHGHVSILQLLRAQSTRLPPTRLQARPNTSAIPDIWSIS